MYRWHSCCPPLNVTPFFHTRGQRGVRPHPPSQVFARVVFFFTSFWPRRPFNSLHSAASLLSPRLSPADEAALSLPQTQITVSICARRVEEGGEEKSIRHQTMAYRPKAAPRRKVTAIHYVWWPANGQCACRQMDCKHFPCASIVER